MVCEEQGFHGEAETSCGQSACEMLVGRAVEMPFDRCAEMTGPTLSVPGEKLISEATGWMRSPRKSL